MRKIFVLAKTLLKGGGALSTKKKSRSKYLIPLILILAVAVFGFSMITITFGLYDMLAVYQLQDIIISFAFGATCFIVFLFGVFYVISTMYHAKDIDMLRSLPLRPYQIIGSKFITLVVYEYIMEVFILLPVLIGFGIKSGAGIMYILYCVLLLAVTPTIGLSISGVLVMIVMRFTSFGKNKQVFSFIGGILVIALAIGLNIGMQGLDSVSEAQIKAIASGQESLVSAVSRIPGVIFASNSLIMSKSIAGLGNLALFFLCCAAATALFLGVGQLIYFQGVTGITESAARRKGVSDISKKTRRASETLSYLKKEMRLLVRSPIGFMNCVLVNLIWPVVISIMLFSSGKFLELKHFVNQVDPRITIGLIVALSAVLASTNAVSSTAVSREGKALFVSKYIPVEIEKQLSAKMINAFILSSISIIFIAVLGIVLGIGISSIVIAFILSLVAVAVVSAVGILIDAAHPKLNWMNEQQAIKQNINVLFHMIAGVVIGAILILPIIFITMSLLVSVIYIGGVLAVLLILFLRGVKRRAAKTIAEMDV